MASRLIDFWGMGAGARAVIRGFAQHSEKLGQDAARIAVLEGQDDPTTALRTLLAEQAEACRAAGQPFEPHVALVVATWDAEAPDSLKYVGEISRTLQVALPGSQSISLTALLPPPLATDEEKLLTLECFGEIERITGATAFLDIVFVNQVAQGVYERSAAEPGAPAMDDELYDLIRGQVLDPGLETVIRSVGHGAVRAQRTAAGRKCCYSTIGLHRFVYLRDLGLEHLETRLQRELLLPALLDQARVSTDEHRSIQARADALIDHQLEELAAPVDRARISEDRWRQALAGDPTGPPSRLDMLPGGVDEALGGLNRHLESLDRFPRPHVLEFLRSGMGCLAAPKLFLSALEGARIHGENPDANEPSGVRRFEARFCLGPFTQALSEMARTGPGLAAILPAPFPEGGASLGDWTTDALDAPTDALGKLAVGVDSPSRFAAAAFHHLLTHLSAHPCDPDGSRDLADVVVEAAAEELAGLSALVEEHERQQSAWEEEQAAFGWVARYFTRRDDFRALRERIEESAQARKALEQAASRTLGELRRVLDDAVVPLVVRTFVAARVRREVVRVADELREYIGVVSADTQRRWDAVKEVPEWARATKSTVLTKPRLDLLFRTTVGDRDGPRLVDSALAFMPPQPRHPAPDVTYRGCATLEDHYLTGPESLLDRLADYSSSLFKPVRNLDALDIIELEGKPSALAFLSSKVEQTRAFLPLSPGLLPLVREVEALSTVYLVRAPGGGSSRLAPGRDEIYRDLFLPESVFVDGDATTLSFICLQSGFPAFAIHALHEARRLAEERPGVAIPELWPR